MQTSFQKLSIQYRVFENNYICWNGWPLLSKRHTTLHFIFLIILKLGIKNKKLSKCTPLCRKVSSINWKKFTMLYVAYRCRLTWDGYDDSWVRYSGVYRNLVLGGKGPALTRIKKQRKSTYLIGFGGRGGEVVHLLMFDIN